MRYWNYLKYLLRHKLYVGIECWNRGLYWRAFVHDLSKFKPDEFIPYANSFYGTFPSVEEAKESGYRGKTKKDVRNDFESAWLKHQNRNPHHWQNHVLVRDDGNQKVLEMSEKDRLEMISDWIGMSRTLGQAKDKTPLEATADWYLSKRDSMHLHRDTKVLVEIDLGVL